jgi:hypothetical protein
MPQKESLGRRLVKIFPDLRTEGQKAHDERKYQTAVLEGWLEHRQEIEKNAERRDSNSSTQSKKS